MTPAVLRAFGAALLLVVSTQVLRWTEQRVQRSNLRVFDLRFARDTDPEQAVRFIAALTSLRPPWYRRWLYAPTIVFETRAAAGRIDHRLCLPRGSEPATLAQLRAALPDVRLVPRDDSPTAPSSAASMRLSTVERPLRTDHLDAAARSLLTSTQPLVDGEVITVQWLLQPRPIARPVRLMHSRQSRRLELPRFDDYELLATTEALQARRLKQVEPLFHCLGRIGVQATSSSRGRYLIERVAGSYHGLAAPGVELRAGRVTTSSRARHRLADRSVPLSDWPMSLNAREVVAVLGWPVGITTLPDLTLGGCRQLPPSNLIPSTGCVIGEATFAGSERPLAIAPRDRLLHAMVTGPTGVGKSTLLTSLIVNDVLDGRGVVVVDPKGDLVTDCLDRLPQSRIRDVVVLDPSATDHAVGFNLLASEAGQQELLADHVEHVFHELFARWWGPRTSDIMRASLLTLMRDPNATLLEIPRLLTDKEFRRPYVARVKDDAIGLGPFWASYEALRSADQAQVISPLMNKLRQCVTRSDIRFCVGQSRPRFDLAQALEAGRLIFVPLPAGVLGEETAALMGSLVISRLWQTVQARSAIAAADRRPIHLYVDEAQKFIHLPTSLGDVLAQARGLGLGMTLALQHLGQLDPTMRLDLLANARSKVLFQTTAQDAVTFAKELRPYLTADDLQGLDRFEVVAQLAAEQQVAPPVTARTLPAPPATHTAKAALAWSRQRYGVDRSAIEAEIKARHQVVRTEAPIGRQKRGAA